VNEFAFETLEESEAAESFLTRGFVARPVDDREGLDRIQRRCAEIAAQHLGLPVPEDPKAFLDAIHGLVAVDELNALRLRVIEGINAEAWLRPTYFRLGRSTLEAIVGNELCMQRRVNLSIQLPDDDSSLLHTHADVWSGDSPFESVAWLPLVDVHKTKSMYLLPPAANDEIAPEMHKFRSAEDLFREIEPHLTWIELTYGEILVFNQNLMHGNRVNREGATRWSMNCRFKQVLSPYADKRFGEFFEPISLKPMTRVGMRYALPGNFGG
jgi:sporadic carbohydrate cluster 2OG-Fe(II) oxygenase